jgi:hypothetical protein
MPHNQSGGFRPLSYIGQIKMSDDKKMILALLKTRADYMCTMDNVGLDVRGHATDEATRSGAIVELQAIIDLLEWSTI